MTPNDVQEEAPVAEDATDEHPAHEAEHDHEHGGPPTARGYLWERVVWPVLVPVAAVAVIGFLALNLSRLFLAAQGNKAVVAASIVSIAIVGGAALATSRPQISRSAILSGMAFLGLAVLVTGMIAQQVDEDHLAAEAGGEGVEPVATLDVLAVDIDFPEAQLEAPSGPLEFTLDNQGAGFHTFVFEGIEEAFKLEAAGGAADTGVVELDPAEYVFYCDVPGHRAAGMEGVLTVAEAPAEGEAPAEDGEAPAEGAEAPAEGAEAPAEGDEPAEGGDTGEGGDAAGAAGGGEAVTVPAVDIDFPETEFTAAAGTVSFEYVNEGASFHTLVVEGREDDMKIEAEGGETATGTIELDPGTYTIYCDVAGHRPAGMEGTVEVT